MYVWLYLFSVFQILRCPTLTAWTATWQAPLSCTIPQSFLKFIFIELLTMLSNHLILCFPLLVCVCVCVCVFLLIITSYFLCLFQHQIFWPLSQISYICTVEVRNRFKGLDLLDRVPDELWMEVPDIVQETGIRTILKKKKYKKSKMTVWGGLTNSCFPGASVRNPTCDKVMWQRSDGQGESNLRASPWYFLSMYPKKPKSAGLCTLLFHSSDTLWKKSAQGFSLLHLKGCFNPKTPLMAF